MKPTQTYKRVVTGPDGEILTIHILNYDEPIKKTGEVSLFCKIEILHENGAEYSHVYFQDQIPEHLVEAQFDLIQGQLSKFKEL